MNSRIEQQQLPAERALSMLCNGMIHGLPEKPGVVGGSA